MTMIEKIITWTNTELPDWQKEAVRKLLTQELLSSEDNEQLYNRFKMDYGIFESETTLPASQPLKEEEILGDPGASVVVVLKRIQNIKNVNALPDEAELPFAHKGLTVIYGENGAGKSGYARIFKKACFARDDKEEIRSNIFCESSGQAEAIFKMSINSQDKSIKWINGQQKPVLLANICVFDSKCARIIIDEQNELSYLPYGADVFQKLSAIIQDFKKRLEGEKPNQAKPEISDLPENTKAGAFFHSLNAQTKNDDLAQWVQWSEKDDINFNQLNTNYAKAQAGDTNKQIRTLVNFQRRLSSFKEKFVEHVDLFSLESVNSINQLIKSKKILYNAFKIASIKPDGPLPGITTDEWQVLYWAAREYSIKHVYPADEFPATGEDKKCVLCMQPLSGDASKRLNRFHEYMESSSKKSFDDVSKKLADKINDLKDLDLSDFYKEDYKDVLDEIESRDKELIQNINKAISQFTVVQSALIKAASDQTEYCKEVGVFDFAKLEELPKIIYSEVETCRKNSEPVGLEKLKEELAELKARKQFAENKKSISEYLKSLKKISLYERVIQDLNTRPITDKGSSLIKEALTPQLMEALSNELAFLNADYLPLNLKHYGRAGKNLHQMKIDGIADTVGVKLTEILSEGEQHVIAVAGFLAELSMHGNPAPIVLDDPVSSLDHKFSEKIATRLVQESAKRQVVVFTHDISFLLDLQEKSESQGQYCFCINVYREGDIAGVTRAEESWHVMSVNKRLNYIEQEITKIAGLYQSKQNEYNQQAGILYGYLRETWEAAIEECLFNKVVRRFQAEIKTQSLKDVVIEQSDYNTIEEGMIKCSKWMIGHDLSKHISDNRPAPYEFQEDVKILRDFVYICKTRRKTTQSARQIPITEIG